MSHGIKTLTMKNFFWILFFVQFATFAQSEATQKKFSITATLQVMSRPITIDFSSNPQVFYSPSITTDFKSQNVGFGINGSLELKYAPWQLAFSVGTTARMSKLYDVFKEEEISDTAGKFISAVYDYNKWAPVNDIHFEVTKYYKLKDEKMLWFSFGVNQFIRETYVSSRHVVMPDSNFYNKNIQYSFGFSAMSLRAGFVRKNVTASLGVYFPHTDLVILDFEGGFKSVIPEFRIGYRFKVL